jgi:hypothetical protein
MIFPERGSLANQSPMSRCDENMITAHTSTWVSSIFLAEFDLIAADKQDNLDAFPQLVLTSQYRSKLWRGAFLLMRLLLMASLDVDHLSSSGVYHTGRIIQDHNGGRMLNMNISCNQR